MHADELQRLQHMGELMVFSEIPTADYLEAAHPEDWKQKTKLQPYHPVGTVEYEQELAEAQKRRITRKEAEILY